ncbi:hypothetical protein F5Y18DRAFT_324358 [Xylariaceae sp. FL1019]|nr:hypothetical protein F5Y18DRAFT_324358 [Xylariaceae sp. FL1019]
MALPNNIDPLESVVSNCPDWLKRLEELSGQIQQRQLDLAKFSEPQPSAPSIRNRGSTESLKPKGDGAAFFNADPTLDAPPQPVATESPTTPNEPSRGREPHATPASDPRSNHTNEIVAAAQRRARAAVRKQRKTDSMISVEGSRPKYRSRRMVLVYYDSFVQSFFEELVKFVSAQRNMMRKAKMAAKVAHIRRLAEMEMPEDESDEAGDTSPAGLPSAGPGSSGAANRPDGLAPLALGTRPLKSQNFMPTRGARNNAFNGRLGYFNEKGDIWDKLDKGLEFVQGMCEHAAHQFLRDGDCNEEIVRIKARLVEVQEAAAKEKERAALEKSNDSGSKPEDRDDDPVTRARTYRPMTVRRTTGASTREDVLAIDEGIQIEDKDDFVPVYRSTRLMRNVA